MKNLFLRSTSCGLFTITVSLYNLLIWCVASETIDHFTTRWTHNQIPKSTEKSISECPEFPPTAIFTGGNPSLPWPGLGTLSGTSKGWQSSPSPVIMTLHIFYLLSRAEKATYIRAKLTCGKNSLRVLKWTCCPFFIGDIVSQESDKSEFCFITQNVQSLRALSERNLRTNEIS